MNIHPAKDIQKYGGPGMYGHHVHEAVVRAHEKDSGCTVHYVTGDVDGGPIILQRTVPVKPSDTPDTLSERILVHEHRIYSRAIQLHVDGRLKVCGKSVKVDYSGDWQKFWESREKAYIQFQAEEFLKEGRRIEDVL
jgi:phosphoribosylglycinamide formyltransferase-1